MNNFIVVIIYCEDFGYELISENWLGNRKVLGSTLFHTLKINPFVSSKITTHFRPSLRLFHITKANHYNNFKYYDFFSLKYNVSKVGSNWC